MEKTAILTGAAGDIGAATARKLIDAGFAVAAFDINQNALHHLEVELNVPNQFIPIPTDICHMASVEAGVAKTIERFGSVFCLVNNAGGASKHSLRATSEDDWLKDIDLNLNGAWRCLKAVSEHMIAAKKGVIVNIASVNGQGVFGHPAYSVAKAGLIHLTRFAAVEFGKHGVRTNAIVPGTVRTKAWNDRQRVNPNIIDEALQWYPSRSASDPSDIADMIAFAATGAPKVVNGAIINIDGGLTAGHDITVQSFTGEEF